ncbi:BatD family protein [Myroides sp. LJL115]
MKHKYLYTLIFICSLIGSLYAQDPIETKVDTTSIKMGDSFALTLRVHANTQDKVSFPDTPTLGDFDVLEAWPVDTIVSGDLMELIKKYELTQFDQGEHQLPELPIVIGDKLYKTQSIAIDVLGVEVDTLKTPLYPIKDISTAGASFSTYWYYIFFIIVSFILGILTFFYIKYQQDKNLTEEDKYKTPFEKASKKLRKLELRKNWTKQGAKPYYSDMSNIVRSFLEDTFDISAHELTTFEILTLLKHTLKDKDIKVQPELIAEFKRILETSDLVKFAKSQPSEQQILSDTNKIQKIVYDINIAYPISAANQTMRIRLREERKKKRMRFRIWLPIAVTSLLLLVTGIVYLINTKSEKEYNFFTFDSTKILLEKQWIQSTYGYSPGITLSTPSVLTHKNEPTIKDAKLEGIEYIEQFRFNELEDPIFIIANNLTMVKDHKVNQGQIIKQFITLLTQNYNIKDINFDQSTFENSNGVKGTKIQGNFEFKPTPNSKVEQVEFQTVFTQFGINTDQVWIFYRQKDEAALELSNRIFESILYKQVKK